MTLSKKLLFVLIPLVTWIAGHIAYTIIDGIVDEEKSADIAVILGNKVNPDGTLSDRLQKRLERGLDIYNAKRTDLLVVSGGLGKEGHYEAEKMKDYLIRNGVPEEDIIVDNYGINTRATVDNTIELRDSLKFNSLIVVSQYFHLTRTKMLFRDRGLNDVSGVSPKYFEMRDIYSLFREFAAYYTQ